MSGKITRVAAVVSLLWASTSEASVRKAFLTSTSGPAVFASWPGTDGKTGAAAADEVCKDLATAAAIPNASTFHAWVSTTTSDAWCRVQGLSGERITGCGGAPQPGAGPWQLLDGRPFAGSLTELAQLQGVVYNPADVYEDGTGNHWSSVYWTATDVNGEADDVTCVDWTSAASGQGLLAGGSARGTTLVWTEGSGISCDSSLHLLCLEGGGSGEPLPVTEQAGALAFVTSATGNGQLATWPAADGLAGRDGADRVCQSLAEAARLPSPETFLAWLSVYPSGDAIDRLPAGLTWKRVDGVEIATDKADIQDQILVAPINVTEAADYLITNQVWTGTSFDGTALVQDCVGWTSGLAASQGQFGSAAYRDPNWTSFVPGACDALRRLYCFSTLPLIFWSDFERVGLERWSTTAP